MTVFNLILSYKYFIAKSALFIFAISGFSLLSRLSHSQSLNSANFVFFHSQESNADRFELGKLSDIVDHSKFNAYRNTTLYAHGYIEKLEDESIRTIVSAYLARGNHNLIVVNWTELASGNYLFSALPNMVRLSGAIAKDLVNLFNRGVPVNRLHVVGHSLGGQLAGGIGRLLIEQSVGRVFLRRITALDPAFPGFYPGIFFKALSASDARFVDVIHTDSGIYGAPFRAGTVDFFPNGGTTLQPGCPRRDYRLLTENDLCSHRRSWAYWAESVGNKYSTKFNAIKAKSWSNFKRGVTAAYDPKVAMGIDCPENIKGKYYLTTNDRPPYAKGRQGIIYEH